MLDGYLTYLASGGLILIGLYVVYAKDLTTGLAIITAGLGIYGQRRATAKVQTGVNEAVAQVKEVKVAEAKECK